MNGFKNLESVEFDGISNLSSIGAHAFDGCSALKNLTIPDKDHVKNPNQRIFIGADAFMNCKSLEQFIMPENTLIILDSLSFKGCTNIRQFHLLGEATRLNEDIGISSPDEDRIYIHNSTRSLNKFEMVFIEDFCRKLEGITLPKDVQEIEENLFGMCDELVYIDLKNTELSTINHEMFPEQKRIQVLKLPNSVKVIGNHAFSGFKSLKKLVLPQKLERIEACAFYSCTNLKEMYIPDSCKNIGSYAFCECYNLESVHLPNDLEEINDSVFSFCQKLKNINIPRNCNHIGEHAFGMCISLPRITIPPKCSRIDYCAFSGCHNLEDVQLNSKNTSISPKAFWGCVKINNPRIPVKYSKLDLITQPDLLAMRLGNEFAGHLKNLKSTLERCIYSEKTTPKGGQGNSVKKVEQRNKKIEHDER